MDLNIKGRNYLVLGASSGFGLSVARRIALEGGYPILVARSEEKLKSFRKDFPDSDYITTDLFQKNAVDQVIKALGETILSGVLVNAGGPVPGTFDVVNMDTWDEGYHQVLRWKVELLQYLMPRFEEAGFGRIVFVESVSVVEPLNGMVLSNVYRGAVQSLVKSVVNELEGQDIAINLLAPGYHRTDRLTRLIRLKSETEGLDPAIVEAQFAANTPLRRLGDPDSFAQLAVWLLSPTNQYVNGQSFVVDGGMRKGI